MVTAHQTPEPQVYHSPKAKAQKAIGALAIFGVIALIAIWSNYQELQLARAIQNNEPVATEQVETNDNRQAIVRVLYYITFFATGILFMRWMFIASKNLVPLGIGVQHKAPLVAIVYWLFPIWHFIGPCGVMKEIWSGSHPDGTPGTEKQQAQAPPSPLIKPWWTAWVIFTLFGGLLPRFFADTATIEGTIRQSIFLLISDLAGLPALVLAILIVKAITDNQEAKSQRHTNPLQVPDTLSHNPTPPTPQPKPQQPAPQRLDNPHDSLLVNPLLSILNAKVTRASLTGDYAKPISSFSSSRNDEQIILSLDYEHDQPADTPTQIQFRFIVIDPQGRLFADEKVAVDVGTGTTGYSGIGIFIWNSHKPRPSPGQYSAYVYEAGNKVSETHWTVEP